EVVLELQVRRHDLPGVGPVPRDGDAVGVGRDDAVQAGGDDAFARLHLPHHAPPPALDVDVQGVRVAGARVVGVHEVRHDADLVPNGHVRVVHLGQQQRRVAVDLRHGGVVDAGPG